MVLINWKIVRWYWDTIQISPKSYLLSKNNIYPIKIGYIGKQSLVYLRQDDFIMRKTHIFYIIIVVTNYLLFITNFSQIENKEYWVENKIWGRSWYRYSSRKKINVLISLDDSHYKYPNQDIPQDFFPNQ